MVRYDKGSNTKSAGKNEMKKRWPDPWMNSSPFKPSVIFQDALQTLQEVGQSTAAFEDWKESNMKLSEDSQKAYPDFSRTWNDVIKAIRRTADRYLGMYNVDTFVMCYDKHEHVPMTKSQTQAKRDEHLDDVGELPPINFSINKNAPLEKWKDYLGDRSGFRRRIIAYVSGEMIRGDSTGKVLLEPGKRFIIDGHCMTKKDMMSCGVDMSEYKEDDCIPLDDIPITVTVHNGVRKIRLSPELYNSIGEAEFVPYFYINSFSEEQERHLAVQIITTDTDAVYLTLLYLHKVKTTSKLPNICLMQSTLSKKEQVYLHVNRLYDVIDTDPALRNVKHRIPYLVACMHAAGSDYTGSHYYVPHVHFLTAATKAVDRIGNLIDVKDGKIKLNGSSYCNLLLYAYAYARKDRITDADIHDITPLKINMYMDGTYDDKKSLDVSKFFPCVEDNVLSGLQLLYYMKMCYDVGSHRIGNVNLLKYGYEKIDEDKPLERGNIKRMVISRHQS
jgi:hypothetical protein